MKARHYIALFLLILFVAYYQLGAYPLSDNNEGLYAEIAREMFRFGHYVIPHANSLPYLEKPPLLYWLTSLSFGIFGVNEFAARFVPATSFALICLAVLSLCRYVNGLSQSTGLNAQNKYSQGYIAAAILMSSLGFVLVGRIVFFDMLLTLWITLGLSAFYLWYLTDNKTFLRLAYAFVGLGLLTKGLVAIVFCGGSAIIFLLIEKQWERLRYFFDPIALLIFFAIIIPWHLLASIQWPDFLHYYFYKQQFLRFMDKLHPKDYYTGPIYYYIPRMLIYLFPWGFLAPLIFIRNKNKLPEQRQFTRFLWVWFLVPFIFFSLSKAKANYYMVVGMPPLALLIAEKVKNCFEGGKTRYLTIVFFAAAALPIAFYTFVLVSYHHLHAQGIQGKPLFELALITFLIYVSIAIFLIYRFRQQVTLVFFATVLLNVLLTVFLLATMSRNGDLFSTKSAAAYLNQQPHRPIYLFEDYENISSLPFYLKRDDLRIIASHSIDLYYGQHMSPKARELFVTKKAFLAVAQHQALYLIVQNKRAHHYHQKHSFSAFLSAAHLKLAFKTPNVTVFSNDA